MTLMRARHPGLLAFQLDRLMICISYGYSQARRQWLHAPLMIAI